MVRVKTFILLAIGCLVIAAGYIVFTISQKKQSYAWEKMLLSSPEIASNGALAVDSTCDGTDSNPELSIQNIPDGAQSVVVDLTETTPLGNESDWIVWNISPEVLKIPSDAGPDVGVIGVNAAGKNAYNGPCPEKGTHHYHYEAYALDTILDLPSSATYNQVQAAIKNHVLAYGSLTANYAHSTQVSSANQ